MQTQVCVDRGMQISGASEPPRELEGDAVFMEPRLASVRPSPLSTHAFSHTLVILQPLLRRTDRTSNVAAGIRKRALPFTAGEVSVGNLWGAVNLTICNNGLQAVHAFYPGNCISKNAVAGNNQIVFKGECTRVLIALLSLTASEQRRNPNHPPMGSVNK